MQCGSRRSVSRKAMAIDLPRVIGTEPAALNVKSRPTFQFSLPQAAQHSVRVAESFSTPGF